MKNLIEYLTESVILFCRKAIFHTFTLINIRKIKIDLDNDLHLEKSNMHYVVILIKSVFNESHDFK